MKIYVQTFRDRMNEVLLSGDTIWEKYRRMNGFKRFLHEITWSFVKIQNIRSFES